MFGIYTRIANQMVCRSAIPIHNQLDIFFNFSFLKQIHSNTLMEWKKTLLVNHFFALLFYKAKVFSFFIF